MGAFVVLAGAGLVTAAALLEPAMDARYELAWWAQLLQTLFWVGATSAVAGVLHRRRAALLGAALTAGAFVVAVALAPWTAATGVTVAWSVEMACAVTFAAIVGWAWRVSDPRAPVAAASPSPDRAPGRALVSLPGGRATSR